MNARELKNRIVGLSSRVEVLNEHLLAVAALRKALLIKKATETNTSRIRSLIESLKCLEQGGLPSSPHWVTEQPLSPIISSVATVAWLGGNNGRLGVEEALDELREQIEALKELLPAPEAIDAAEKKLANDLAPAAAAAIALATDARTRFDSVLNVAEAAGRELVDATAAAKHSVAQLTSHGDRFGLDVTDPTLPKNDDQDRLRHVLAEIVRGVAYFNEIEREHAESLSKLRGNLNSRSAAA